jgi:excisionase family DNA binding protein
LNAYLSPDEVARMLGVDRKTVYAAIRDGRLPALRLGRTLRVSVEDLGALAVFPASSPTLPRSPRPASGEFMALARRRKGV